MAANSNPSEKIPPIKELWESMLPELLTEEQLLAGLAQKNISAEGMDKAHLVELFKRMVMPLPQRRVWQSRAKVHTDAPAHVQRSLSSTSIATTHSNGKDANDPRTKERTDTAKHNPFKIKLVRNDLVQKMERLSPTESEPSPKKPRQDITWP